MHFILEFCILHYNVFLKYKKRFISNIERFDLQLDKINQKSQFQFKDNNIVSNSLYR